MNALTLIIVSFLLTTVLGGLLSTYFQWRTWDHQRKANLSDRELQKADAVCRQVSNLQDKVLYRMLRLYQALKAADRSGGMKLAEAQLKNYDETLFEWNDQRNVSLALVGAYFGQDARALHREIHEKCQLAETELDAMYKRVMRRRWHRPLTIDTSNLEQHLRELNELTYRLGVFMMIQIRSGRVGRTAPNPVIPQASPKLIADPPMTLPGLLPGGL